MKPSVNMQPATEPYLAALSSIHDLDVALSHLRHKKTLLDKDLLAVDERLATVERERPGLLEHVLGGRQPECVLVDQENLTNQLKAERKSKQDLLALIATQIEEKAKTRTDLNARLTPHRKRIFAAIEEDLVASMPKEFLPFIKKLAAVSSMNSRTWISIIQGHMPEYKHADWEQELNRILEEYGIPSH